ncbi:N-6 DNA methylase [Bacillus lacus]|uniref:N-6 DNA methylase n=1 Tax=Metabacillus lacus TaxID=1983721 RepID=A0A7X2IXZ2_9BACI|nr:class I SAM-dependent methyltransferase [Metabacillus lacus]MRX71729.1 N-6 DNA methylase [Metabacillus lacus]
MQGGTKVEKLFAGINETADLLARELDLSYIEAVAETGENMFHEAILQEGLSEVSERKLNGVYRQLLLAQYSKEEIRKSFQLAILKGLKEGSSPNHQMTPDTVGIFMGYLVSRFTEGQNHLTILDPAVGAGNLLTTVLNNLGEREAESVGVDVDELLIKLAYINANLQKHPVQFFNQDSLQPLLVDPADIIVSDLPVGYYPNDAGAKAFKLAAEKGHSYSHHLFIEQSLNYAKPGAYLFLVIPNQLFQSQQADSLRAYLKETAYVQGLLQLPLSMFGSENHGKSIFILQKKGEGIQPPKEAMLSKLPKFSDAAAMKSITNQMNTWFTNNK